MDFNVTALRLNDRDIHANDTNSKYGLRRAGKTGQAELARMGKVKGRHAFLPFSNTSLLPTATT